LFGGSVVLSTVEDGLYTSAGFDLNSEINHLVCGQIIPSTFIDLSDINQATCINITSDLESCDSGLLDNCLAKSNTHCHVTSTIFQINSQLFNCFFNSALSNFEISSFTIFNLSVQLLET